jgi:leucyl aminopeptidase
MATSQFRITQDYTPRDGDFLLCVYLDGETPGFGERQVPAAVRDVLKPHDEAGGSWTVYSGRTADTEILARTIRLDSEHSTPRADMAKCVASGLADARKEGGKRIIVFLKADQAELGEAAQEGALLGGYNFDKYLEKKQKPLPVELVLGGKGDTIRQSLSARGKLLDCVNFARDVLNEPPNVIQPPSLAKTFKEIGEKHSLQMTVWDDKKLAQEKCGAILGVGMGAKAKPRLVIGEYKPRGAKKHLALVGKGVTFDSGGYGLKPANSQVGMKYDMGGAAMMFAAACAIARLKLPVRVTVVTPLVENDISGEAYHTTSILTTRSGKTVEVHHTDAEGRLILADALTLAQEYKPDMLFDAATLTGACVMALGDEMGGVYGTNAKLTQQWIEAGQSELEQWWQLPLHMPYREQLKTTVADCKNIGNRSAGGGSITAALFLRQWIRDDIPWIHCDIAGPGGKEEPMGHLGAGAKGFGVKTMVALAQQMK